MRRKGFNTLYLVVAATAFLIAAGLVLAIFFNVNAIDIITGVITGEGDRLTGVNP